MKKNELKYVIGASFVFVFSLAFISLTFFKEPSKNFSLLAVGDVMLSREVERRVLEIGDFTAPFAETRAILADADLTLANLETPLMTGAPVGENVMYFRADPRFASALQQSGFDILNLANNHTGNFGAAGLSNTLRELEKEDLDYVGAGDSEEDAYGPLIKEVKGLKIAFLAYTEQRLTAFRNSEAGPALAFMEKERVIHDIENLKDQVDFIIVSMHAGEEYNSTRPTQKQIEFARAAIDAGAELVIGHHPHVLQPIEEYRGKFIFYSLGNFVFDQMFSEKTREAVAVKFYFEKDGLRQVEFFPNLIHDYYLPKPVADKNQAATILRTMSDKIRLVSDLEFRDSKYELSSKWLYSSINDQNFADLDKNGREEEYALKAGKLTVTEEHKVVWESPAAWQVQEFCFGDINNDGETELIFTLWKEGSFGPSQPFWIKEYDKSVAQHVFIYSYQNKQMRQFWASSNLDAPISNCRITDLEKDGKYELLAEESSYQDSQVPQRFLLLRFKHWNLFVDEAFNL